MTIRLYDFSGLTSFADYAGEKFLHGVLLYTGSADCWKFGFLAFSVPALQSLSVVLNIVASPVDRYQ